VPFVIETAVGCDRLVLASMCNAYREEVGVDKDGKEDVRVVMGFHPRLAPVKFAILPLSKKEPLMDVSEKIFASFRKQYEVQIDEAGSIGKRYRRQDEIGTPFCVTVDFETLEDKQVTVRERDTMKQERVAIDQLEAYLKKNLNW
jgi:glycyl-tRNA synthetase